MVSCLVGTQVLPRPGRQGGYHFLSNHGERERGREREREENRKEAEAGWGNIDGRGWKLECNRFGDFDDVRWRVFVATTHDIYVFVSACLPCKP